MERKRQRKDQRGTSHQPLKAEVDDYEMRQANPTPLQMNQEQQKEAGHSFDRHEAALVIKAFLRFVKTRHQGKHLAKHSL